ncbi:hypothetical protein EUGRSUZ_C03017 [Eucalyptus grandis]|uniref:Uncharacterized protein n=2 Tax=Eucalyptus grandis TaxID=71139 RepID=A0ACC3LHU2_EUCGR|nr:hypothetical protein EUGRSUZ_C03017 [Eucalyptus grandis]
MAFLLNAQPLNILIVRSSDKCRHTGTTYNQRSYGDTLNDSENPKSKFSYAGAHTLEHGSTESTKTKHISLSFDEPWCHEPGLRASAKLYFPFEWREGL